MKCDHKECGAKEKVWLEFTVRSNPHGLKSHPFCIKCGMIKNIGSDKSKSIGYYMNILSYMEKQRKMKGSKVIMRLIAKELEKIEDFDDAYTMSRYNQERIFTELVKKYYQINENIIQSYL